MDNLYLVCRSTLIEELNWISLHKFSTEQNKSNIIILKFMDWTPVIIKQPYDLLDLDGPITENIGH